MSNFLLPYPDLAAYRRPTRQHLAWLLAKGVLPSALRRLPLVLVARGCEAADGCFEEDPDGEEWLVFPQPDDVALGQDLITAAGTFAFGGCLRILQDPLSWLQWDRDGLVIIDWHQTHDWLRDAERHEH